MHRSSIAHIFVSCNNAYIVLKIYTTFNSSIWLIKFIPSILVKCILASICCLIYKMCRVFQLDCNRKLFLALIIRARSCRCYLYLKKMAFSMLPKQLQFCCNDVDLVLCTYIHKYIYLIRYISYACISYEKKFTSNFNYLLYEETKPKVLNLISHIF